MSHGGFQRLGHVGEIQVYDKAYSETFPGHFNIFLKPQVYHNLELMKTCWDC